MSKFKLSGRSGKSRAGGPVNIGASDPRSVWGNYATGNAKWQEVKRAYESAMRYGGVPIMPFAQGMQFVRDVWRPHYNGTGICQALVSYWIAEYAAGGSLWNVLMDQGRVNSGRLVEIARQQNAFGSHLNGDDASAMQKLRSMAFLTSRGVVRRPGIVSRQAVVISGAKQNAADTSLGMQLGHAIAYKGMENATEGGLSHDQLYFRGCQPRHLCLGAA